MPPSRLGSDWTIIIPSRGTPGGPLAACLRSLSDCEGPSPELIVSIDGPMVPDDAFESAPTARFVTGDPTGPAGARNRAIPHATADRVLFLNDDVTADAGLLAAHDITHDRSPLPSMVLGLAPWKIHDDDRLIDRLLRETSLVFFYDRMLADPKPAEFDWGFRHAWTLNLSLPRSILESFDDRLRYPMLDDLEWACRSHEKHACPVLFTPDAVVTHDHRYTAEGVIRREVLLGHQAVQLESINASCASATFGGRFDDPDADPAASSEELATALTELTAAQTTPADAGDPQLLFQRIQPLRSEARRIGAQAARAGRTFESAAADAAELLGFRPVC